MTSAILKKLVAKYLLAAMTTWVPLGNHYERDATGRSVQTPQGYLKQEDSAEVLQRYESIADDIIDVSFDDTLEPLFRGNDGRLKSTLLLASVSSMEGVYQKWVDNGDCNTAAFQAHERVVHPGHPLCDGGIAWSIWQIHMYRYVIKDGALTQATFLEQSKSTEDQDWIKAHKDEIITGPQIVRDRKLAAKIAYYLMRGSLQKYNSLCTYTGENCDGAHPLADHRLERAKQYLRTHPFTLPPPEQLALMADDPGAQNL